MNIAVLADRSNLLGGGEARAQGPARQSRLSLRHRAREVLFGVFEARSRAPRPSLVYCGDNGEAKEVAATMIRDVGFDPVDAGALQIARYIEPFALLIAQLAYEGEGGPELAYRFERFGASSGPGR